LQNYILIQEVDHRWNSALDMIERQLKLRSGLNRVMADIQKRTHLILQDQLNKMSKLVDVLKHIKATTEVLMVKIIPLVH